MSLRARATDALGAFKQRPWVATALELHRRQEADGVGHLAAAVTYYLFLSVLPAMMLALSILGWWLSRQGLEELQSRIEDIASDFPGVGPLLEGSLDSLSRTWTGMSLLALVIILWAGTGGIGAVRDAIARIFHTTPGGNIATQRGRSLGIIFAFGPLLLASVAATTWATTLGDDWSATARVVASLVGVAFAATFNFVIFIALYRLFVPSRAATARNHWPGAALTAVSFTLLTVLGSTYAQHVVTRASLAWGTFAGVVGALVILNLAVKAFLYGAELTAFRLGRRRG